MRLVIDFTIHKHIISFIILFLVVEWYRGPIMFMSLIALNQFSLANCFGLVRSAQFYLRLSCDMVRIMADLLSC